MDTENPQQCAIHGQRLDKMETYTEKMDKLMFGNGNPENGFLFKLEKVMDYMLDAKIRRANTEKFRRSVTVTLVVLIIGLVPAIIAYGTLVAEVQDNKAEIIELRK